MLRRHCLFGASLPQLLLRSTLVAAVALTAMVLLPGASTDASGINAGLICEPTNTGAFCEAQPFNPSYSYGWTATGNLTVGNGSVVNQIGCVGSGSGGTVTVTVTAPGIGSDSASRSVGCSGPGTGPGWIPPGGF